MSLESADNFTICRSCGALAGLPRGRRRYRQACRCDRAEQERWPGFDFNEHLDLCWCCGLEPIPSGSKWSSFYCADCRERVRDYNEAWGRALVYLGRHSLMNDVVVRGPGTSGTLPPALAGFLGGMTAFYDAMDRWRPSRLQTVLAALGPALPAGPEAGALRLADYLAATAALTDHPALGKRAAFAALLGFLRLSPATGGDATAVGSPSRG